MKAEQRVLTLRGLGFRVQLPQFVGQQSCIVSWDWVGPKPQAPTPYRVHQPIQVDAKPSGQTEIRPLISPILPSSLPPSFPPFLLLRIFKQHP